MIYNKWAKGIAVIFLIFGVFSCSTKEQATTSSLFDNLPQSFTGIDFANNLKEDVGGLANVLDFDFFYNGAGVGAGDFNNDGLVDLFFTGNQVSNRLYLNKGEMTFVDISEKSGITASDKWCNGVSVVDINDDGFLDIYVSVGGPEFDEAKRENLLFINQQDLTFKESSLEYGLNDSGFSTQALFFDYDQDGDVDCLVGNESYLFGYSPITFYQKVATDEEVFHKNSSHFYRNDNGKFVDVSKESGILRPSFSLGLTCHDFNSDGWLDFYMANDYFIPDVLFINKGDGTFEDQTKSYFKQLPYFGMGLDVADVNNDLQEDLFVLDMASSDHIRSKTLMKSMDSDHFNLLVNTLQFPYQYMFNAFQLNDGNDHFVNIANALGMAKTDWSWTALLSDFDNDGLKDVYVTNGYRRYALDNDFAAKVDSVKLLYKDKVPLAAKQELYNQMPVERLSNLMYKNGGDLGFKETGKDWNLDQPGFSNGAVSVDLDNDGDLDLVVNNIDEVASIYRNKSSQELSNNYLTVELNSPEAQKHAQLTLFAGEDQLMHGFKSVRGYLSSNAGNNTIGLGTIEKIDSAVLEWPGNFAQVLYDIPVNQKLELDFKNAHEKNTSIAQAKIFREINITVDNLDIQHEENSFDDFKIEILLPYKQSTIGPSIAVSDLNNDGTQDLVITGARNRPSRIYNQIEGKLQLVESSELLRQAPMEDVGVGAIDLDGDGQKELYFARGGNELEESSAYYNDLLFSVSTGELLEQSISNNESSSFSGKAVEVIDFDGDGDDDLLVGNRIIPQKYPLAATSFIYENVDGVLQDVTTVQSAEFSSFGIINDIAVSDLDNDGDSDFIAVAEWGKIGVFINDGEKFTNVTTQSGLDKLDGLWLSVSPTDINNDGLPDFVVGNLGLNSKFKATAEKPFKIFANDFDNSGTLDIVLSAKYKDEYVPVRGRECSSEQMPFIAEKFEDYSSFANADIYDIYGEDIESKAYSKSVNELRSIILINQGGGKFHYAYLPPQAQLFPLQSAVSYDIDGNGFQDLILGGGIYDMEVETPRLDGGQGLILYSDGKSYITSKDSRDALHFDGDVKDMALIQIGDQDVLLVARNNDNLLSYIISK